MVEKFLQEYERKILEEAKTLTTESLPVLTEELFALYEKTGNRLEYEKVYFQRRKHLSVAAIAGGDIEKTLLDICKETTWALPAHVNRQIEGWENTIDLFAAETAFYLAEISMKHRASLQPDTLRMVQQEVLRRVLLPFAKSKRPYAFWEQCDMNWNAVCNGAIGCGALWLLQDDEALETGFDLVTDVVDVSAMLRNIIQRVTENLPYYLNGFSKDGVCPEGLSYYTYGLTFYFAFADLLQKFTGSDGGLLENPRLSAIATFLQKCYLPGGYTLSFSDGNIREKFRIGLQSFMAMHFEGVKIPNGDLAAGPWDDACYRYVTLDRDIEWTRRYPEWAGLHYEIQESELTEAKGASVDMFPDAQWAVIRRENSAIAIKGGHNGEPHNHNDVGSVMYIADGSLLLTDLGAGEYTKEYFGAGRYDNLCCSSLGHSVPIIDEGGQRAGTEYKATEFQQMGDSVTLNMAGAYDLEAEESIRRSVFFREKDGALTIRDVFKLKEGRKSVENLVTPIRPVETEKGFLLEAAGKQYRVTCDSFLSKRVLERTYHNHAGVEETVWMMQWDVMDCTIVIDLY